MWLADGTVQSVMSPDRSPAFSLSYDLEPGDLRETYAAYPGRRRSRIRAATHLGAWGLIAVVLTLATMAMDEQSVPLNSPGAPSWMYAADLAAWLLAVWGIIWVVGLSPGRMAQRVWRALPEFRGRHRDEVTDLGVTSIAPDATQAFTPWSAVTGIRETDRSFQLLGETGRVRHELPKRGLQNPDLISPLRQFMHQAVSTPQHASGPETPASR